MYLLNKYKKYHYDIDVHEQGSDRHLVFILVIMVGLKVFINRNFLS
jgi:hypothetical protein